MKKIVIVGAGTAGTTLANRLVRRLPDWLITVVEPSYEHVFLPDLTFVPFGSDDSDQRMVRARDETLHSGLEWIAMPVAAVDPDRKGVVLDDGTVLDYDMLVIASGCQPRREASEQRDVFDYCTMQGAKRLRHALSTFSGGRLVVHIADLPNRYVLSALEVAYLADAYFRQRGMRHRVDLSFVTPADDVFGKAAAARALRALLERKDIRVVSGFHTDRVGDHVVHGRSDDGTTRKHAFDLLVTLPPHRGAGFVERSSLGDERGFIPADPRTLRAFGHDDIYVLGDAAALPVCKAGSAAHFQADVLEDTLVRAAHSRTPQLSYDGHANCLVATSFGKAMVIDYNYDVEPGPGRFPSFTGPFTLLSPTRINHAGKLAARWMYWTRLLPGKSTFSPLLTLRGKRSDDVAA